MAEDDCNCCGVPDDAVILSELHIVEFLNKADGEIYKMDLSHDGSGNDLPLGRTLELAEWAKAIAITPLVADLIHDYTYGEGDEGVDNEV